MHLWSEYEGRTIAGAYTLKKLLRSEGRNAFFTTVMAANGAGAPESATGPESAGTIRLTEAHFDEEEMLQRWRQVAAVDQGNLLLIKTVGQTHVDEIAVAYAVLEQSDADLGEVLRERPLTAAETEQVAKSVAGALRALHANGLVHGSVQASNVLAVGETVKLRSDCVRECVADQEFVSSETCEALRRNDVRDLGVLLLQCLTLETEWTAGRKLPVPFAQMVPGVMDGSWNLEKIAAVLEPPKEVAAEKRSWDAGAGATIGGVTPGAAEAAALSGDGTAVGVTPAARLVPVEVMRGVPTAVGRENGNGGAGVAGAYRSTPLLGGVPRRIVVAEEPRRMARWLLALAGVIALVLVGWYFARSRSVAPAAVRAAPAGIATAGVGIATAGAAGAGEAAERGHVGAVHAGPVPAGRAATEWHVVAYTYNHRGQAEAKVVSLRRIHNSLHPQVFSPSGEGPYLVTLGGGMDREQANQVLRHARRAGMPRDTFVQNY